MRDCTMILFIPYYIPDNVDRYNEILICIQQNINNTAIQSIVLVCETPLCDRASTLITDKCIVWNLGRRVTYSDVFEYANTNCVDSTLCILVNSDIFLDESIHLLSDMRSDDFACISRHDVDSDGNVSHINETFMMRSQDTWVFRTPVCDTLISSSNFRMGINGCDNRIAKLASDAGYTILNPSLSVITYHLHNVNVRTYNRSAGLSGSCLFVWPTLNIEPAFTESYNMKWPLALDV